MKNIFIHHLILELLPGGWGAKNAPPPLMTFFPFFYNGHCPHSGCSISADSASIFLDFQGFLYHPLALAQ